jgi:hypothetical protein
MIYLSGTKGPIGRVKGERTEQQVGGVRGGGEPKELVQLFTRIRAKFATFLPTSPFLKHNSSHNKYQFPIRRRIHNDERLTHLTPVQSQSNLRGEESRVQSGSAHRRA